MKVAILVNKGMANSIFDKPDLEFLASFTDFNSVDELPNVMTAEFMKAQLPGSVCTVSCWGTPCFDDDIMACAPDLRLIAHAAGSVKHLITEKTWRERKCRVTSNAGVIAESVAQTTLAFILTSLGQLWALSNATKAGKWSGGEASKFTTKTLNGLTVGIIGLSLVGREVIKILKPFNCKLLVYDPYVSPFEFESLGVCGTDLNTLLATSNIVTVHAPSTNDTYHMLNSANLPFLQNGALFINTARGTLVEESALIKELETGRIFACIDVTDPEPPAIDHPFRTLDNVILTPHIAGGHTINGRHKLGRNSIKEIYNYLTKGTLAYEVREEMLERMA